jgi:nitrogen fixation NifU-like protein
MTDKNFVFFQDHSKRFLEMALNTDRQESMPNPDGYGKRTGDCGDTVEFFLKICEKKVQAISYNVHGCINTNACCNAVAQMVEGESVNTAWSITPERVIDYLETLPKNHEHCAELAVGALYLALSRFQELNRDSQKKRYRRNS